MESVKKHLINYCIPSCIICLQLKFMIMHELNNAVRMEKDENSKTLSLCFMVFLFLSSPGLFPCLCPCSFYVNTSCPCPCCPVPPVLSLLTLSLLSCSCVLFCPYVCPCQCLCPCSCCFCRLCLFVMTLLSLF